MILERPTHVHSSACHQNCAKTRLLGPYSTAKDYGFTRHNIVNHDMVENAVRKTIRVNKASAMAFAVVFYCYEHPINDETSHLRTPGGQAAERHSHKPADVRIMMHF